MIPTNLPGGRPERSPKVVLVSEPDDALRRALSRALAFEGFAVIPVPSLPRALAYLDHELESERHDALPDVVVTYLPQRGPEQAASLALIRRVGRRVPMVLLTDGNQLDAFLEAPHGSVVEILEKPVAATELRAAVFRAQARRQYH